MKVFISWSGERSKGLAEALREWLPLVIHYAVPWLSESDIEAGERWGDAVAQELEASNYGIICVTRENVDAPWILFEAGALAKSVQGSRVVPLLLDLEFSDISGPLGQFQAKKVDKSGLEEVVRGINLAAAEPDSEPRMKQLFEALWPQLDERVTAIPEQESAARRSRPQSEILEELVSSVRALDVRLREFPDAPEGIRRRDPRMVMRELDYVARTLATEPNDPIKLLLVASAVRDEAPWFYELALDTYRAVKDGKPEAATRSLRRLREAADYLRFESPRGSIDPGFISYLLDDLMLNPLEFREPEGTPRRKRKPTESSVSADE